MLTLEQLVMAVIVAAALSLVSLKITTKRQQKHKDIALVIIKDSLAGVVTTLTGQPLKIGMHRVQDVLTEHKKYLTAVIHECPDFKMVIFDILPRKASKDIEGIKVCLVYDDASGNYLITGNVFVTPMTSENAYRTVHHSYHHMLKTQNYNTITKIAKGSTGTGFAVTVDNFQMSMGTINRQDKSATVGIILREEYNLNNAAMTFILNGHILDL